MDFMSGPKLKQVEVSHDGMKTLRKQYGFEEGEAFFSATGKELPKESFNRKTLVAAHESARLAAEQHLRVPKDLVVVSSEGLAAQALQIPALYDLKEIFFPQLEVGKRHPGRVLFGTFCVKAFKISSVNTVLADKSGKAVRVVIYNVGSSSDFNVRFSTGSKVAIKEPFFKLCADCKVAVRVQNPGEIVLVDDSNKEIEDDNLKLPTPANANGLERVGNGPEGLLQCMDNLRSEGNGFFAKQEWSKAIVEYSRCIELSKTAAVGTEDSEKIKNGLLLAFSNRAEAWLQQLNFKNALDDANKALEIDSNHSKSVSRRDRAWLGFGKVGVPQPPTEMKVEPIEELSASEVRVREDRVRKGKEGVKAKHIDPKGINVPSLASSKSKRGAVDKPPHTQAKSKASDSKNASLPVETSKGNVTASKDSVDNAPKDEASEKPTLPESSKLQLTDVRKAVPLSTISKENAAEVKDDVLRHSGEKLGKINTKRSLKVATLSPEKQLPETTRDHSPLPASSLKVKPDDVTEKILPSPDAEQTSPDSESEFTPPHRFTKRKIDHTRSPSPPRTRNLEIAPFEPKSVQPPTIDIEDPLFASWLDSCRSLGDSLLAQGKWGDAICIYDKVIFDKVLGLNPPKKNRDKVIQALLLSYSHRSEAWIWLGNYENSLRDANCALELVATYPKSLVGFDAKSLLNEVRRGRAYHGLGEFEVACSIFSNALVKAPSDKSIQDLLEKSRICNYQSRDGLYDLNEYFLNGCRGPPPPCSDFVGPVVIRRAQGKGRGLFLTKDVQAGDLLLVSNPLAVVRRRFQRHGVNGDEDEKDQALLTSKWRRSDSSVGLEDFVERLALLRSERKMYQLYSLTIGDRQEEVPIPDINVFIPGSPFELPMGWENLTTDLERLRCIVRLNGIDGGLNPLEGTANNHDDEEAIGCVGLWVLPSFMNHSCAPNCHMIDVGNAMFVRASRSIAAGEELCRAYFDVYQNGPERQRWCDEWLFVCNCERCVLEKRLTSQRVVPLQEYRKLLERVREESLKRLQKVEKGRSLSLLLPNPQPALLQLRKFADWFERVLVQVDSLTNTERAWVSASHLEAFISRFQGSIDVNQMILALEIILEFMTNTAILGVGQAENAIHKAALLLNQVEMKFGTRSRTYRRIETRVLDLYRTAYGNLRKDVLLNMTRFLVSASIRTKSW